MGGQLRHLARIALHKVGIAYTKKRYPVGTRLRIKPKQHWEYDHGSVICKDKAIMKTVFTVAEWRGDSVFLRDLGYGAAGRRRLQQRGCDLHSAFSLQESIQTMTEATTKVTDAQKTRRQSLKDLTAEVLENYDKLSGRLTKISEELQIEPSEMMVRTFPTLAQPVSKPEDVSERRDGAEYVQVCGRWRISPWALKVGPIPLRHRRVDSQGC